MSLITELLSHQDIVNSKTNDCSENGIAADISTSVSADKLLIICLDDYYHSLNLSRCPPSTDCLIVLQAATEDLYHVVIVELKNICSAKHFNIRNVYGKFDTSINDFMKRRFRNEFLNRDHEIARLRLFFVTDCYSLKRHGLNAHQISKALSGTKIENLLLMRPFEFRGKLYQIEYRVPNPLIDAI